MRPWQRGYGPTKPPEMNESEEGQTRLTGECPVSRQQQTQRLITTALNINVLSLQIIYCLLSQLCFLLELFYSCFWLLSVKYGEYSSIKGTMQQKQLNL